MCGIAGIIRITPPTDADARRDAITRLHAEAIPETWLDILDESIKHRGPDGQGRFRDRAIRADGSVVDVALVHRRLSIIDHACGAQPMVSLRGERRATSDERRGGAAQEHESLPPPLLFHGKPNDRVEYKRLPGAPDDDLVAVVFNGCIYNHRELRAELERAGHEFVTDHSDTEVLLHGWREWGKALWASVDAMFVTALWDARSGSLHVARDLAGEKPMHGAWFADTSLAAFANVPTGLFRWLDCARPQWRGEGDRAEAAINPLGWLRAGGTRAAGPYAPIHQLRPRQVWTFNSVGGRLNVMEDQPIEVPEERGIGSSGNGKVVERLLVEAVRARLEADVPLACLLSGGVDSSLVSWAAQSALRGMGRHLSTYTVKMPVTSIDESEFAEAVARSLGTRHVTLDCDASPATDLVELVGQLGLPFGDSSLLPTYWVSRAVGREAKVCLSGDGGDELFGGYSRYRAAWWLLRFGPLCACLPPLPDRRGRGTASRIRRLGVAARNGGYESLLDIFQQPDLDALMPGQVRAAREHVEDPLRYDFDWYLPDDLLRKSDTASMAVPIELRAPLLSAGIVNFALRAPPSHLMPRGQRKGLLRQVARKYLPAEIVDRAKQGFAIPIGEWFRSDYGGMKTLLLDRLSMRQPFGPPALGIDLNRRFIEQMIDEHMACKRDHSQRLYMLLVLSLWTDSLKG